MKLKFQNIFFAPDKGDKGKIVDTKKGVELDVSRDELSKIIAQSDSEKLIVLPAGDVTEKDLEQDELEQ